MLRIVAILAVLSSSHVAGLKVRAGVWAAPDLQAVSGILEGILHLHMTPENRKAAEQVAKDVKEDIADVVDGKNLSKQAKRQKVASAIKEIDDLQHKLTQKPNMTALNMKIEQENKEIQEKKAELMRDQKALKVMKLKKELMEKKLKLAKLMEGKMQKKQSKDATAQEAKAQSELVERLEKAEGAMKDGKAVVDAKKASSKSLSETLAILKGRSKELSETISKMDADEKQRSSKLDAIGKVQLPATEDDPLAKGQKMLKNLEKEEHRKFVKARAIKKAQLAEIDAAIRSIEKGDANGLQQTLNKMKTEVKAMQSKTGSFLY